MSGGWNSALIHWQEPHRETRKGAPADRIPYSPLSASDGFADHSHESSAPFQESTEETGNRFTCHISTKTHASQVTKQTEIAIEEGLKELLEGLF